MKYQSEHLEALIRKVKEKSGARDYSIRGFNEMVDDLKEKGYTFDPKYLKYKLYDGKSESVREARLDDLCEYLGYKNYRSFVESLNADLDPVLQSLVGQYYCYIRMNKEKGKLLRSPVEISIKEGEIRYHLRGGRLTYNGAVTKKEGCIFVLMTSPEGKSFYHVYRVGARRSPVILQGIFSGVSTDFEPIGGRAILWRSEKPFNILKTGKLDIVEMQKSKKKDEQLLAAYFQRKEANNLSIKSAYTFGPEDLE